MDNVDMEKVKLVVDDLENYSNEKGLSWLEVYREVIKKYDVIYEDNNFLRKVVKEITNRNYDITAYPFKLTRFQ